MSRFPPEFLQELKARVSITEVVGRRVTWDRRRSQPAKGDNWACCPFHGEKTPSFHVVEREGYYHCFGCHESGGAIDFLMKLDNLSFPEAVEMLATDAGLPLPERKPADVAKEKARLALADVTERAVKAFQAALASPEGKEARAYLARRGLAPETIERFEIGYAPAGDRFDRDPLTRALVDQGATLDALVTADIAGKRDNGGAYDRFSHRVMFPIRDVRGRCVAFGGRALSPDARAKYLNSRETPLFDKGRTLYNLGPAKAAAFKGAPLVVVEGYMDVIALAEAGFDAAVAPMGTALTETQLALLWRVADEPIIALDGDTAGIRAASRAADLALPKLQPGKSLRFAWTPAGLDPDDLVRSEDGPQRMAEIIDGAEPLIDLVWRRETGRGPLDTPERRAAFEKALLDLTQKIEDETVRFHYRDQLKERKFQLFRGGDSARGHASQGGRQAGGFGKDRFNGRAGGQSRGRAGFGPAVLGGPAPETLANALGQPQAAEAAALREAALLVILLNHPGLGLKWEQDLDALQLGAARLDSVRNAIISALAAGSVESDDAEPDVAALERAVDTRCGPGVCADLRALAEARLPRSAARGRPLDEAEPAFLDALTLVKNDLTWRRECEDYGDLLLSSEAVAPPPPSTEGEEAPEADDGARHEPKRLQSAQRAARIAPPDASTDEGEQELSRLLQSFVDGQPWIRRGNRRSPPSE